MTADTTRMLLATAAGADGHARSNYAAGAQKWSRLFIDEISLRRLLKMRAVEVHDIDSLLRRRA